MQGVLNLDLREYTKKTSLGTYEYITRQGDVDLIIKDAKKERYLGLDTENSGGLDVLKPSFKLLLFQISVGRVAYLVDPREVSIMPFKEILEDDEHIKIIQNAVYDYKSLAHLYGIHLKGMYDTQIGEQLLHMGVRKGGNSLEDLSLRYLGIQMDKKIRESFYDFPYDGEFTDDQLRYAADDVLVLEDIKTRQMRRLKENNLQSIAWLEFALVAPVAKMELAGFKIDADKWRESLANTKKKLFKLSVDLHNMLPNPPAPEVKPPRLKKDGTPYANAAKPKPPPVLNLDSPQQIAWALKEVGINLEFANKKTRKGLTNNITLKFARGMSKGDSKKEKILDDLMSYRGLKQTDKTFGENLLNYMDDNGRIHARFHQNGTESGRFSSSDPNLQNIQKKGEEGKILRSCFIPEIGNKFVVADYSQIELRIAAEMSGDPVMIRTLRDPSADIHRVTGSEMYGLPLNKVTGDIRRAAKTLNFGIIYGMTEKTLSDRLECTIEEAAEHLKRYEFTYGTLMAWLERQAEKALAESKSETIEHRIRWFPTLDPNAEDYKRMRSFYGRVGRNHPVQGTSADMTKTSMVILDRYLDKYDAVIVNTVHDEICVEVPEKYAHEVAALVNRKMIVAGQKYLSLVPILVDAKIRDHWYSGDVDDDYRGQQLWLFEE